MGIMVLSDRLVKVRDYSKMVVVYRNSSDSYDPTRTTALRNAFASQMKKRFSIIKRAIREAIIEQDVFGLEKDVLTYARATSVPIPGRRAFQFMSKEEKVTAFMEWLRELESKELLTTRTINQIGAASRTAWTNIYVEDSYKRGVQRARYELNKANKSIPTIENTGGIGASMSTPFHIDRVGMLYIRAFDELKGISSAMDTQISKVLAKGIIDGDGPRLLAKKLTSTIDGTGNTLAIKDTLGRYIPAERRAMMLARTEVIRAHHLGMVQEYKNWGLAGVTVIAEWSSAADDRTCDMCSSMDGNRYTLQEIETMIPAHPLCRCIAVPVSKEIDALLTPANVEKALEVIGGII